MIRILPRSLLGQVLLAMAAALLIAQAISTTLLYRAAEQRRETAIMHSVAFQLLTGAERSTRERRAIRRMHGEMRHLDGDVGEAPRRLPPRLRYSESDTSPMQASDRRLPQREEALRSILEAQGIAIAQLVVTVRPFASDPGVRDAAARFPLIERRMREMPHDILVAGLRQQGSDIWQVARIPVPPRDRAMMRTLVLQTLILFLVLVGLVYLVLRRITRPLAALAESTRRFAGAGAPEPPLDPTGPDDVRHLIEAHNAMQSRIGSMLDEKDVMLGAIGHDLKTPLAALRVRIESVENTAERARMAAVIEDITTSLDDILSLARVGRADGAAERVDLAALAASVVEEYEDMSEPVTLQASPRVVAPVRETWLKRALRNLVGNALRYGGTARVSLLEREGRAVLQVDDDGPGIPADRIASMLEPFQRGETSRNRATGGAGLGLTLARAIAEQHGGTLVLANRPQGGLRAEIRLPL